MTSDAQIQSNRANAAKSTGPRTGEGKKISSRNALSHGLSGRIEFLSDQEALAYIQIGERLIQEMEPVTLLEEELVKTIQDATWQLNCYRSIEGRILRRMLPAGDEHGYPILQDFKGPMILERMARYAARFRRDLREATREFDRIKAARLAMNRAKIIAIFEERTKSRFDPVRDRIGTPTGFDLQNCRSLQLLHELKQPVVERLATEAA